MDEASTAQLPVAEFVHQCLDLTKSTIRVLQILPGRKKDPISCTLKHVPRAKDTYLCLSYMWGDAKSIHSIIINGRCFSVRENLWKFMHLARKLKIRDWLWIDALCINQSNNKERNHQVQQMADIYREAKHVLVYPGDTPFSVRIAAKVTYHLPLHREPRPEGPDFAENLGILYNKLLYRMFKSMLLRVVRLQYWFRSWIVQEVLLAKYCFLVTGSGLVDWEDFQFLYSPEGLCPRGEWRSPVTELCKERANMEGRPRIRDDGADLRFVDLFIRLYGGDISYNSRCTEIRDHVYSLLGLASGSPAFEVDYEKTLPTLYLDTLEHFIPSIGTWKMLPLFMDTLVRSLRVGVRCYCPQCADLRFKNKPDPHFTSSARAVLLDVYEKKRTSSELDDTCAKCGAKDLLPPQLGPGLRNDFTMIRMAPDKMYCISK